MQFTKDGVFLRSAERSDLPQMNAHCQWVNVKINLKKTNQRRARKLDLQAIAWKHSESDARIELVKNAGPDCLYAVRLHGNCLSVNGEWSFEPSSSNRTEEFLRDHRFDSLDAAEKALNESLLSEYDEL